jgi:adenine-specific DNA-methyltransferase
VLPEKRQSFYNRLGRLRPLIKGSDGLAEALVLRVLHVLVAQRFPLLSRRLRFRSRRFNKSEHVVQLAKWLGDMEVLELAFWLSSLYANLVSKKTRKHRALFFTPPKLSSRVIADIQDTGADFSTARFIDPACGGAAFLAPVAGAIRKSLRDKGMGPKRILLHLQTHITGWDLDPVLCKLCKAFVWMVVYEDIKATGFIPALDVTSGDALTRSRRKKAQYDVVVCNPPYRKVPTKELKNLSAEHRAVCTGQPNLYAIFMRVAVKLAVSDGRIALLTPTSFLSGQYFSPLRKHLTAAAQVCQVDLVEKRQGVFVGVEQETAVTILRRQVGGIRSRPDTKIFAIGSEHAAEFVGCATLPTDDALWVLPRAPGDVPLLRLFKEQAHTIASYGYETRTGLFVPHRDKRRTVKKKGRRKRAYPLIWSTDIGQSGRFKFERTAHEKRFVIMRLKDDAVVRRTPSVALQRTTAKDDARRLVAAPISERFVNKFGGYIGENHVVFLSKSSERAACEVGLLSKILRSKTVDRLFRCMSGSVAVSASELGELPLPDPQVLNAALARGETIETAVAAGYRPARRPVSPARESRPITEETPA